MNLVGCTARDLGINMDPFVVVIAAPVIVDRALIVAGIILCRVTGIVAGITVLAARTIPVSFVLAGLVAVAVVPVTIVTHLVGVTIVRVAVFGPMLPTLAGDVESAYRASPILPVPGVALLKLPGILPVKRGHSGVVLVGSKSPHGKSDQGKHHQTSHNDYGWNAEPIE